MRRLQPVGRAAAVLAAVRGRPAAGTHRPPHPVVRDLHRRRDGRTRPYRRASSPFSARRASWRRSPASSVLITANWALYIYCVATDQLVESSLGYFITPLVSFALGFALFGERMSRLRLFAVALAARRGGGPGGVVGLAPAGLDPRRRWRSPLDFTAISAKRTPVAALDGLLGGDPAAVSRHRRLGDLVERRAAGRFRRPTSSSTRF